MLIVLKEGNKVTRKIITEKKIEFSIDDECYENKVITVLCAGYEVNITSCNVYDRIKINDYLLENQIRKITISGFDKMSLERENNEKIIYFVKDDDETHIKKIESEKKLPFVIPEYTTYPKYTAMMAILAAYCQEKIWIYNNFILLWADIWVETYEYWSDFKFGNENIKNEFCPLIQKIKLKEHFFDECNFIEKIKFGIDKGIYFCLSLDMLEIDEWWGNTSFREHCSHQSTIYGYDDINKIFLVADFFQKKYKFIKVPYNKLQKAYFMGWDNKSKMVQNYVPDEIFLYKFQEYEIRTDIIKNMIKDFIFSQDNYYFDYLNLYKCGNVAYGFEFFKRILIHINNCLFNKQNLDVRPFQLLYEMNSIMADRIKYLIKKRILTQECVSDMVNFEKLANSSSIIVTLVMKYKISRNKKLVSKIKNKFTKLVDEEKEAFINIYSILEDKEKVDLLKNNEFFIDTLQRHKVQGGKMVSVEVEKNVQLMRNIEQTLKMKLDNIDLLLDNCKTSVTSEIYTDNYYVDVFPYEKERFGRLLNGKKINKTQVENGIQYFGFDKENRLICNSLMEDELVGYNTMTHYIYLYEDKNIIKVMIYENKERNCFELGHVWVLINNDNKPATEFYYGKNMVRNISLFQYEKELLIKVKVISFRGINNLKTDWSEYNNWEERYYYDNENLRQIVNIKGGRIENVYPKYGKKEYNNYNFKILFQKILKRGLNIISETNRKINLVIASWNEIEQKMEIYLGFRDILEEILFKEIAHPYGDYIAEYNSQQITLNILREVVYELMQDTDELGILCENVTLRIIAKEFKREEKIRRNNINSLI